MSDKANVRLKDGRRIEIVLDLSRLMSRILHRRPTGVDRVEMAYARLLTEMLGEGVSFAAVHPAGPYGRLDRAETLRFLAETETGWADEHPIGWLQQRWRALRTLARLRPRPVPKLRDAVSRIYIQASPHHLTHPDLVRAILLREKARMICLVHDLIPIEFPEYARPSGAALHRRRIDTMIRCADGLITNSAATADSLGRFLPPGARLIVRAIHLGTDQPAPVIADVRPGGLPMDRPFFVMISTIEPRKNHLMLLNLWRSLAETTPSQDMPMLVLIGRRGWENENVIDMLERCTILRDHVIECSALTDQGIAYLLYHARALLCPSFAEGFGMPVAEALAAGTPVICSDLPALKEVGCGIPEFLDPLDGLGWRQAIIDYCHPESERRGHQIRAMSQWEMPSWKDHLDQVLQLARDVALTDKGYVA